MSDEWNFYFHELGEHVASTFVDLGIHNDAPLRDRPILLRIRLQMLFPREDGLSSSAEYDVLKKLEDHLAEALKSGVQAQYVGRTTADSFREFCFYVPRVVEQTQIAQALRAFPEYAFKAWCEEDGSWRHYLEVLYPSDEEFETIKNLGVIDVLEKHGDTLKEARPVTHWSFFKTDADRQSFLADALELGFSIHDLHEDGPEDFRFVACLERDDHVNYGSINSIVLELFRLTENHRGTYDGWETQVVEDCESSDCE